MLVVSEEAYRTCNTSKPQRSFHGGETVFRLTKPGAVYFIGGAAGKCDKGQKLVVVVMSEHGPKGGMAAPPPSPEGFVAAGGPGEEAPPPVSASTGVSVCMVKVMGAFMAFALLV